MAIKAPRGTSDMLPQDSYKWQYVQNKLRDIASTYGIREIRTPMFESTELFVRGVGETTDVVQKEMYTFEDKKQRSMTLKPEGTAPAVRAFIQHGLFSDAQPTKLYYFTPVFRYEKAQKGRYRQHHQFGVEIFGCEDASIDSEIISLAMRAYREFGIDNLQLNINSIGCPKCRKKYNDALKDYLKNKQGELCETCLTRLDKNPLRILDCKENHCKEIVKEAPIIIDFLCDECKNHFEDLQKNLDILGIEYTINPFIVRGLDYYTKTVFEIINNGLTVCGGGRYDNLIKEIGGPATPAAGFGMGLERLLITLEENNIEIPTVPYIDLFIGYIGDEAKNFSIKYTNKLRENGIKCDFDHVGKKVKAQMKYANKINARFTIILGDNELEENKAKFKRMDDGKIFEVDLYNIEEIKKIIMSK